MSISLFMGRPAREPAYQPRHSLTRPERHSSGRLAPAARETTSRRRAGRPRPWRLTPRLADLANVSAAPDLLDRLTSQQLRGLLEDCTRDDYVRAVPEIAYLIAHSSHTARTLTDTWDEFRQSTRAARALRAGIPCWQEFLDLADDDQEDLRAAMADAAAAVMSRAADFAWRLMTNGREQGYDLHPAS